MSEPIPGPKEGTDEWLALRKYDASRARPVVFGASDAAAVCGRSQYKSPLECYLLARRELDEPEFDKKTQDRLRRGRLFQPLIMQEYSDMHDGRRVIEPDQMYFHADHDFMAASPDGIAYPREGRKEDCYLVEAKATTSNRYSSQPDGRSVFGQDGTDYVPDEVMLQVQQQLAVMDMEVCDVVAFFGVFEMRVYPITRNDVLISAIVAAEQELYERIVDQRPPEANWSHPRTKDIINQLYGYEKGTEITLDMTSLEKWSRAQELTTQIARITDERDALKNELLWQMEGKELARFSDSNRKVIRSQVEPRYWTFQDADEVKEKVGTVKRKGYTTLREKKLTNEEDW